MRHCCACYLLAATLAISTQPELAAQHRWPAEVQAGPFLCHADFSLKAHEALLAELSALQQELAEVLGMPPPRECVHLFLFQSQEVYQAYLRQHFPRVPYRRALFIKARGPGMVFAWQGADFEVDVRHECTHALLHAWLPSIPLWLDEGLAEYFEYPGPADGAREERRAEYPAPVRAGGRGSGRAAAPADGLQAERAEADRGQQPGDHPHLLPIKTMARYGQAPRLEELEAVENLEAMGRDEYRDAWAWVHFMLHGPRQARDELIRYLDELHGGGRPGRLSERLRRRIPDLNRRIIEHFG